jgi:hypothetical protein
MKLQLITDQGGSIEDYYAECYPPSAHPSWSEPITKIRKLFDHLEHNVEGPAQWVTISHGVWFYLSEEDDWDPGRAQVIVELAPYGYKIQYRSARELHYWDSFTTLKAPDEVEAGEMILQALQLAERNLPGRGDAAMKNRAREQAGLGQVFYKDESSQRNTT